MLGTVELLRGVHITSMKQLLGSHRPKTIELAKVLGISKSYCSMLLNNKRPISKNIALKLRDQFGIPLDISLGTPVHKNETVRKTVTQDCGLNL